MLCPRSRPTQKLIPSLQDPMGCNRSSCTKLIGVRSAAFQSESVALFSLTTMRKDPPPPGLYAIGTQILLAQLGAGQVTVAGAGGVTVNSRGAALKIAGQYGIATLVKTATDTWLFTGDVTT